MLIDKYYKIFIAGGESHDDSRWPYASLSNNPNNLLNAFNNGCTAEYDNGESAGSHYSNPELDARNIEPDKVYL